MLLNLLAGIVGGIWLAITGDWALVGVGLGIGIAGTFFASILLMPGMLLAVPIVRAAERGEEPSGIVVFLGVAYTYAVMGIWAILIFSWFATFSHEVLPVVLWAYAASTGTWAYLAQKEAQTNEYSAITSGFHQIGCAILIVYALVNYDHLRWQEMAFWYGIPMAACAVFTTYIVASSARRGY
jgi:hypothetical protein